ncbi:MAG: biotin--[acetyl-CoA-carboxylase] ligase [Acidobacteria bacterium]|nr:biotin--[acetyl-CoA-carboxylase] ligase [Acidobacteriota bacterium]
MPWARAVDVPVDIQVALAAAAHRLGPLGATLFYYPSVGSTNDIAMRLAMAGADEGTTVIAEAQEAGRGRRGRTWHSPPGSGVYVSVVLRPRRFAPQVTLAAGVALAEGVSYATGLLPQLKWPNDLMIGRRKIGGILAESQTPETLVLGYGINLRSAVYPNDLAGRVTSLEAELGKPVDRGLVVAWTLAFLATRYGELQQGHWDAILERWRDLAPGSRNGVVEWRDGNVVHRGTTHGVDDSGRLIVQSGDALHHLVAGEIRWL